MSDVIQVADKVRELVGRAPAGGIFTNSRIGDTSGVFVPGYGGAAGFTIQLNDGFDDEIYQVMITPLDYVTPPLQR